ncbi:MAG: response regulator [Candidatus Portnoybacteria bacterium]|jgi:CheY-like chemotaxis protein|nr:response regulator [Candidatus Portnoybacteria bacterium]
MIRQPNAKALILYIEDDSSLAQMYKFKMEREGIQVILAVDGREGVKMAQEQKPDLILLDILMPELDGWWALKLLKSDSHTKDIPVIVLTNLDAELFVKQAQEAGAVDFLVKAKLTPSQVLEKIKEKLKK